MRIGEAGARPAGSFTLLRRLDQVLLPGGAGTRRKAASFLWLGKDLGCAGLSCRSSAS